MTLQKVLSRVRQAVEDYHMIEEGDRIAVGISGGKDSLTLLLALNELRKFYPQKFSIYAVTVDLGFQNLDLDAVEGELLLVSQFTLYADCKKGNRPSFIKAGNPDIANELYEYIIDRCRESIATVEKGIFGADMKVSLLNDGPFTILLDSEEIC